MKKRRNIFIFILISILIVEFLVLLFSAGVHFYARSKSPEKTLIESFNLIQARIVTAEACFWGALDGEKYKGPEELKKLASGFSNKLGIVADAGFSNKIFGNDTIHEIEIDGILPCKSKEDEKTVSIRIQSPRMQPTSGEAARGNGWISVYVTQDLTANGLEETTEKVGAVFKKFGIKPRINTCITGSFEGKLSHKDIEEICRLVFGKTKAQNVAGIRNGNLISVSAYSPYMYDNYINLNEKGANINLAVRYNQLEDKTYIWLATPDMIMREN